jgi:integrase/recombinase XerD
LRQIYKNYKTKHFPNFLETKIPGDDKQHIKELLNKPWNPYIRRHCALTEKSKYLKEHILRQHSGWSRNSQMHLKYLHYFGNESSESILEEYGIIPKEKQLTDALKPKQCPNCDEPNRPDSKFCAKCRMVLTYDAYSETLEKEQQRGSEVQNLKVKYEVDLKAMREEMERKFQQILTKIDESRLESIIS